MVLNYIYKYIKYKRMIKIFEIYQRLLEYKATEAQGLNILKKAGAENAEGVMSEFKAADVSNNQKNLPIMAYLYASGYKDIRNITSVVNDYNNLEKLGKVKTIQLTRDGLVLGDNTYNDFIKFSEFIHGKTNELNRSSEIKSSVAADFKAEKKPIWSGNGIDIYDGVDVGRCIKYTQGGLTGKRYSFCIGQPGNSMYQSYRDNQTSTFYFIVDKNKMKTNEDGSVDLSDPLHIVVFDHTQRGPLLTDADNHTGNISEYGNDANGYVEYLKSMGVPVELLENKPKTPEEEREQQLLGRQNTDLEWFIKLPYDYKSKYIGRGHVLTDDQFDYLMGK
jgi:hypothetical protein